MTFNDIWNADTETDWNLLFKNYWFLVKVENIQIEYELNRLTVEYISSLGPEQWYQFLYDKYFVWKYTAKNRLATTRMHLRKYKDNGMLNELYKIKEEITRIHLEEIKDSLAAACKIKGLGVAGASGLLSLIYPDYFATVDQFVVKALKEVEETKGLVVRMNPDGLTLANGEVLTEIMRKKGREMNEKFKTAFWTPRTLEMSLWAYRS